MLNTNSSTTDVNNNFENVIDDDSFEITGTEKKNNGSKIFKFIIPTLAIGALITVGLIVSLFIKPVDKEKSNKVAKNDFYGDTSSLEDFLSSENSSSEELIKTNEELETDEELEETDELNPDNIELDVNTEANDENNTINNSNENIETNSNYNNYDTNYYSNSSPITYSNNYSSVPTGSSSTSYNESYNSLLASNIDISNDVAKSSTNIPLLLQSDYRWGSANFAGSTMSYLGSGPTCLSMVYLYFDKNYTYHPLKIATDCTNSGYTINGVGASPSFMTSYGNKLGLKVKEIKPSKTEIIGNIFKRRPIIAYMKPGSFSSTGSYIVIRNYNMTQFMIHDPNSSANSSIKWKFNDITKNIDKCWAYYK